MIGIAFLSERWSSPTPSARPSTTCSPTSTATPTRSCGPRPRSRRLRRSTAPRVPASTLDAVRAVPGVAVAEGDIQVDYAQIVDENGDPIGNPGQGPPTLGFGWGTSERPESVPDRERSTTRSRRRDRRRRAFGRSTATSQCGDTVDVLTVDPPKQYKIVGLATFGSADSPAGASVVLFTVAQAQTHRATPTASSTASRRRRSPASRRRS